MTVLEVAKCLKTNHFAQAFDNQTVCGVACNSEDVKYNYLFIPVNVSGIQRIKETDIAIAKGASAILWERGVPGEPEDFAVIYVDDLKRAQNVLVKSKQILMNN